MIGYHITVFSRWEKIRIDGLIPYQLHPRHQDMRDQIPGLPEKIIWLWRDLGEPSDVCGVCIDRAMKFFVELRFVVLKVRFKKTDLVRCPGYSFCHVGSIEHTDGNEWVYHDDAKMFLLKNQVKPINIKLLTTIDFNGYVERRLNRKKRVEF